MSHDHVARRSFLAGLGMATLGAGVANARPANPWAGGERWFAGDHHIHTHYSGDGQYSVAQQVAKAREYGLDWVVITDHGGVAHEKFSLDLVTPDIERTRRQHRDVLVYQGLEWNIPGAEHATLFLPPGRNSVDILRAFEAAYDGGILSTPVAEGGKGLLSRSTAPEGEPYALAALRYLDAQVRSGQAEIALMFANHPARRGIDSPHELRGWRDAAPEVAVGMEGAPGHQAAGIKGGRGGARGYYDGSPNQDSFAGFPAESYRTHGGFDWMTAKVGGMWDAMLAEGKPWWVTATSDSHQVYHDTLTPGPGDHGRTGTRGPAVDSHVPQKTYGDFFPGFYSSTVVGARSKSYVDVMRGLQAGKVIAVHGRLVDGLNLRVRSSFDARGVTLGGRTFVRRGGDVEVTIDVTRAGGPNHSGAVPRLAKVDLIAGPITGPVSNRDAFTAPETSVVKTFEMRGGRVSHTFRGVERSFYLRVRGSDGNRLTSDGGPVMDVLGDADPWSDLWFYANPVFVDVL